MEIMAHGARYAAAMTAITRRLPFGLANVVEPSMLGYLLINLCTFFIDLGLLGLLHGKERLPIPVAVTISYGTASLVSYVLNRVFNFRSHAGVGRQLPVFIAVSASNYLIFVLGLTDLLSAVGVYYELARVLAACCEAVYLYCMLRWIVFRDTADADHADVVDVDAVHAVRADAERRPRSGRRRTAPASLAVSRRRQRRHHGPRSRLRLAHVRRGRQSRGGGRGSGQVGVVQVALRQPGHVLDGVDPVLLVVVHVGVVGQHRDHVVLTVPGERADAVDMPAGGVRQPAVLHVPGDAGRGPGRDAPRLPAGHLGHQAQLVGA